MRDNRWNCDSLKYAPDFKRDLRKGTSERAYVHALSSAAVSINIAKRCSMGDIQFCGCRYRPSDQLLDSTVSIFWFLGLTFLGKIYFFEIFDEILVISNFFYQNCQLLVKFCDSFSICGNILGYYFWAEFFCWKTSRSVFGRYFWR